MSALQPYGPALRKQLAQQLNEAIEAYRATLHPEDAQMAPLELRSWMKACDTKDQETVDHFVSFALPSVQSCHWPAGHPRHGQHRAMRMPHAIYAIAALNARFGVDRSAELPA